MFWPRVHTHRTMHISLALYSVCLCVWVWLYPKAKADMHLKRRKTILFSVAMRAFLWQTIFWAVNRESWGRIKIWKPEQAALTSDLASSLNSRGYMRSDQRPQRYRSPHTHSHREKERERFPKSLPFINSSVCVWVCVWACVCMRGSQNEGGYNINILCSSQVCWGELLIAPSSNV